MSKNRRSQHTSLEHAYSQHIQNHPELHMPNVIQGHASNQELKLDFKLWLGGLQAAVENPAIMSHVKRLTGVTGFSQTGLFDFIGQPSGQRSRSETSRRTQVSEIRSGQGRSIDEVTQNIVDAYQDVKQAAA